MTGEPAACLNCGATLAGPFCHACGQRAGPAARPVREIVAGAADDLLSWDSRLLRTLRALMLRPGSLTREHWAGRRVDYVPPFRLYLLASALNVGLAAALGDRSRFFFFSALPGEGNERVIAYLPRVMFVLVPAFAAIVALVYRRPKRMYAEHFVFALHFHSATFLLACVHLLLMSPRTGLPLGLVPLAHGAAAVVSAGVLAYTYLAFRTAYGRGHGATLLSTAAVLAGYALALSGAIILTVIVVARLVRAG